MFRPIYSAAVILSIIASYLSAGPRIEVDPKTFDYGTMLEGKVEKIDAVFIVKNTGDAPLKLETVRPGCGCTVVKFDSLVPPGKSVKIESQVNIKGYKSGNISKGITVNSNAENEPLVRLMITAKIKAAIDVSDSYLSMDSSNINSPKVLFLSSQKKNLMISDVSFKPKKDGSSDAAWQNSPIKLKHKWIPTDSINVDSSHVFRLEIYSSKNSKPMFGEFILKTNHLDKPEIVLTGKY
ncbi:MAG: DUF1573 domain-containing protein [Fibrobacter sp.]|nr:DUF1573 domain-containing protein [Fibrobacter sp.]